MFTFKRSAKLCLVFCAISAFLWRGYYVIIALTNGNENPLLAYPFTVIFPAILITALLMMKPTKTREGLLMRFGTIVQLVLILWLPNFALYLALGFPVVFLTVELFETKLPRRLIEPLSKLVLV